MNIFRILAINPGSTSTKIAVYEDEKPVFLKTIRHSSEELAGFEKITDQYSFRKEIIYSELETAEIKLDTIQAVVGRGGLIRPIPSGVYLVNERMKADLINSPFGEHASNLGGLIADDIAHALPNARAFIADPVVVDELDDIARISGHPEFKRVSIFHGFGSQEKYRDFFVFFPYIFGKSKPVFYRHHHIDDTKIEIVFFAICF